MGSCTTVNKYLSISGIQEKWESEQLKAITAKYVSFFGRKGERESQLIRDVILAPTHFFSPL